MRTYKIIRMYFEGDSKVIKTGLTLKDAQAHCRREDTHKRDSNGNVIWFDGYTEK